MIQRRKEYFEVILNTEKHHKEEFLEDPIYRSYTIEVSRKADFSEVISDIKNGKVFKGNIESFKCTGSDAIKRIYALIKEI